MKLRFANRHLVRMREREARRLRHSRDRHDRAWLVGAGGVIGHWKIESGLWKEEKGRLVCMESGVATGPYTKDLPAGYSTFDPTKDRGLGLRVYEEPNDAIP